MPMPDVDKAEAAIDRIASDLIDLEATRSSLLGSIADLEGYAKGAARSSVSGTS